MSRVPFFIYYFILIGPPVFPCRDLCWFCSIFLTSLCADLTENTPKWHCQTLCVASFCSVFQSLVMAITEPELATLGGIPSDYYWQQLWRVKTKNSISDFFFSCPRFFTLAKMVLRSQCLLFTRKELNWMVLILPSCMDMEASTYQLHQATGKQENFHLLKHLVLTTVTDRGQGGLQALESAAFQVLEKQGGGHKDCTSVCRHHLSALSVLSQRDVPRVTEGICQSKEMLHSSKV